MPITTGNAPKALWPGLGGGDMPLQQTAVRDAMTTHGNIPGASRGAPLIPSMGTSNREAHHNCGGPAYHDGGKLAHCCQ